ncbi:disintegrin and metalloproteinase domain-containing protein 1a [Pteropus alecto]|uniref:Disintegrin and metalloproteinase domain-containing protein 1a n=1 Tax=Pteropus alecto TaxID=9402 RepID=L5KVN4_PTEAL|nr:disintegrin and metalloproteinase domain-containing protein 1a [Pteropus alecto]ELK15462.1 Disintegrin and metalloproteinase domain-containing protein 1a [Pteropus alecto]
MSVVAAVSNSASFLTSLWKNQVIVHETSRVLWPWAPQMKGLRLALLPGPSCVRSGIMLVLLLSFLPSLYCDLGSVYYSSYEIVIPKSLTAEGSDAPVEKASYVIFMQGQKQLIHLTVKRDYFVTSFPVFSYHGGILRQEMPFLPHDCHYEGYIQGVPGSFVSVNTCSGLRGILVKEAKSYGIEPVNSSKRFEHVLYTVAHRARVSCSVPSRDNPVVFSSRRQGSRKPGSVQVPSYLWSHTKYVEMFVVVNNQRFQMWGSNVNDTVQRVADIVALANSFTRGINTQVLLAGMEIWSEGDLVEVPVDLQVTLSNFNSWRQEKLLRRVKHDVAHMIVGQRPAEGMGQAFLSGACSSGFAAAVESFHHEDVLLSAALMVHELGHNLGIQHDHSACICQDGHFCLMHENISKESGFSNCSSDYYYQFLREHKGACLFNNPQHKGRLRRNAVCGNGVVEDDEQCDCGSECQHSQCCDDTCMLTANAKCGSGPCCRVTCEFELEGVLCRPALGECDLPEYCDGSSDKCPTDRYKQDGTSCDRNFYCFHGICGNPDKQCTHHFGMSARSAPDPCYRLINSKGDRFGNCGLPDSNNSEYVKCSDDNIFCGKIICTNVKDLPQIKPHYTMIQIPHGNGHCWSMDAYNTTDISDEGDVHTGTLCAPNKVCMNYSCTDYTVLNYDCNPVIMCNGKGVCNNLKHCHCEAGYAPPDCKTFGHGGSVDSGPPGKPNGDKPDNSQHLNDTISVRHEKILDRMISLLFLLFIILLAIIIICLYINCKSPAAESIKKGPAEAVEKPSVIQPGVAAPEEAVPKDAAPEEAAPEEAAPKEAAPEEAAPAEAAPAEMPGEGKEVKGEIEEPEA